MNDKIDTSLEEIEHENSHSPDMGEEEEQEEIKKSILEANVPLHAEDIERLKKYEKFIVAFSGGKDSMGILLWCLYELVKVIPDIRERMVVVYVNIRDIDFPEIHDYNRYVEIKTGLKIHQVDSHKTFHEELEEHGFPFYQFLWCHYDLKMNSLGKWYDEMGFSKDTKALNIVGVRGWESLRRALRDKWLPKDFKGVDAYYPVFSWKEKFLLDYIKGKGFTLPPSYELSNRTGCWICPNMTMDKIARIRKYRPELFAQFKGIFTLAKKSDIYTKVQKEFYLRDIKKFLINPLKRNLNQITKYKEYENYIDRQDIVDTILDADPNWEFRFKEFNKLRKEK